MHEPVQILVEVQNYYLKFHYILNRDCQSEDQNTQDHLKKTQVQGEVLPAIASLRRPPAEIQTEGATAEIEEAAEEAASMIPERDNAPLLSATDGKAVDVKGSVNAGGEDGVENAPER